MLITFFFAALFAQTATPAPAALPDQPTIATRVNDYVRPLVAGRNFSGCILLAREGHALLDRCYGMANYELNAPNTPATRFHIASVSKSFTAAAILLLEQQGKLKIEDKLAKFIPDYPNGDKITLHELLTHTSGIPDANGLPDYDEKSRQHLTLEQVIALFKDKPLDFAPGTKYAYSNSNYNLLAYVIEQVSGMKYGDFLEQRFFKPLAMTMSGADEDPAKIIPERAAGYVPVGLNGLENAPYLDWAIKTGNGSLYSTARDLLKWDQALHGPSILDDAHREQMFKSYGTPFSYGWYVREEFGRKVEVITGRSPGFTSSLQRFPDENATVILTANTYSGLTTGIADDMAAILLGEPYRLTVPARPIAPNARVARAYLGDYQFGSDFKFNPGLKVTVAEDKVGLYLDSQGRHNYLVPTGPGTFIDRVYGGKVTFVTPRNGLAQEMKWNFGQEFVAKRTNP